MTNSPLHHIVFPMRERSRHRGSRWPYISVIPWFGVWAPIYAGVKAHQRLWIMLGTLWSAICLAALIPIVIKPPGASGSDAAVWALVFIVGWVGAMATSFVIRGSYDRMASPLRAASEAGEVRLQERRDAQRMADENPSLAREIGIGRPDTPSALHVGLVDVNNAPASALVRLFGIDDGLATRIIDALAQVDGFSSLEDLGTVLDLPGHLVDRLRDHVVFL